MPEGLGGYLNTGYCPFLTGKLSSLVWISSVICSKMWVDRTHYFRDYLLGYSKFTADKRSAFFMLRRFGTGGLALGVPAAWGNPSYLWATCRVQVGILQKQSYEKPEVPDQNIVINCYYVSFHGSTVLWSSSVSVKRRVTAAFPLGSLRAEGPKCKNLWRAL